MVTELLQADAMDDVLVHRPALQPVRCLSSLLYLLGQERLRTPRTDGGRRCSGSPAGGCHPR